jgi:hypothetical protein
VRNKHSTTKNETTRLSRNPGTNFTVTRNQIWQERRAQLHRCESLKSRPHSIFIEPEDNHTCNDWNISHCSIVQNKGKLFCRLCNFLVLQYLYSTGKGSNYGFVWEYFAENLQTGEIEMAVKCAPPPEPVHTGQVHSTTEPKTGNFETSIRVPPSKHH